MPTVSSRFETIGRAVPAPQLGGAASLHARLGALYARSQKSNVVFASPLGPFFRGEEARHVPRFVYFGPQSDDRSLRLAFLAGFDGRDLRSSHGLAGLIETLVAAPNIGQGLNLSFFPVVDVLGATDANADRNLADADWAHATAPELQVLKKDARARGYHGFVRIETTAPEDIISFRLGPAKDSASLVDLVSSADFEPWSVRWERATTSRLLKGPLSVVDDLPVQPFDLRIKLPAAWSEAVVSSAIVALLSQFIARQRAMQAYAQHL